MFNNDLQFHTKGLQIIFCSFFKHISRYYFVFPFFFKTCFFKVTLKLISNKFSVHNEFLATDHLGNIKKKNPEIIIYIFIIFYNVDNIFRN